MSDILTNDTQTSTEYRVTKLTIPAWYPVQGSGNNTNSKQYGKINITFGDTKADDNWANITKTITDTLFPVGSLYWTSNYEFNPNVDFQGIWFRLTDAFIWACNDVQGTSVKRLSIDNLRKLLGTTSGLTDTTSLTAFSDEEKQTVKNWLSTTANANDISAAYNHTAGTSYNGAYESDINTSIGDNRSGHSTVALTIENMPSHTHTVIDPGHEHEIHTVGDDYNSSRNGGANFSGDGGSNIDSSRGRGAYVMSSKTGISIGMQGGNTPIDITPIHYNRYCWERVI